jgi:formate--tetrahydrofolate ligase
MGGMAVAQAILAEMASHRQSRFHLLYPDDIALDRKLDVIARRLYGADGINLLPAAAAKLSRFEHHGYRALPICVAKTQNSLSDDPRKLGRPSGFQIVIRDAKLAAGAGFVVAYAGEIMTMPGLPKDPSAQFIDIDSYGDTVGLF